MKKDSNLIIVTERGYIMDKKCPKCGSELKIVLHGLVTEKYLAHLKDNNIPFYNAGCMCYGDDRDAKYKCSNCGIFLDEEFKEIILISCPRVLDYRIRKEECGNGALLEQKYKLKDRIYCEACKLLKTNSEEEYRKAAKVIDLSDEVIEMVIKKKNRNLMLKTHMQYKKYLAEEDEVLHRIKYWNH